jgi:hypothetical protein
MLSVELLADVPALAADFATSGVALTIDANAPAAVGTAENAAPGQHPQVVWFDVLRAVTHAQVSGGERTVVARPTG